MKSRGAEAGLAVILCLSLQFGLASPAIADLAGDGQAAFDARDFTRADAIWHEAAAKGSGPAMLGLGLLRDLGLGTPRDPKAAFDWYLAAANRGVADAQFNVGVMLDAGVGVPRQLLASAGWYGRAAANGHVRARYNLGLLFSQGDGVPQNADLARYWLQGVTGDLAAAADRLGRLAVASADQRVFAAPIPLSSGMVQANASTGDPARAEMAWAAGPAAFGMPYLVEMVSRAGTGEAAHLLQSTEVHGSAIRFPLTDDAGQIAWRVSRRDDRDGRYAAAPWRMIGDDAAAPPLGVIRIDIGQQDRAAQDFSRDLIRVFEAVGYWTEIRATEAPQGPESRVTYAYEADQALARDLAVALPGFQDEPPVFTPDATASPGMVVLHLSGGRPPSAN